MLENFMSFFSEEGFMPHGMCYLWRPNVLTLHVVSDSLIALAYASIPFTLLYFVRKRKGLQFSWIFVCFAVFIVACGATHVMEIVVIWRPAYWLSGFTKAITALASVSTAVLLVKLIPEALSLPSPAVLKLANDELDREIVERERAQAEVQRMNQELETRVEQRTLELKAANRSLRASQELLDSVMRNSPAVIYIKDLSGKYLLINRQYEELFHVTQEWMIGKTDHDIFSKPVADAFRDVDERVLSSAIPLQMEETVPLDDGTHTYLSIKNRLLDADGKPYAICGVSTDVTENKRAENRFRLALEAAPTGMLLVDQGGSILLVNKQIERLFGYARDELIGQSVDQLVPHRFREQQSGSKSSLFSAAIIAATEETRELSGWRKDGGEFPIEIGLSPVQTSNGLCVIAAITDLTSRKNSEELFRVAVEASPTGMIVVDSVGRIVLANSELLRLFGYQREELIEQSLELLIPDRHQKSHVRLRTLYSRAANDRQMGMGRDLSGRRKDGTEFPLEISLKPVMVRSGLCTIAAVTDLTARKAAEYLREEVERARAHLAAIVESSDDAIVGTDLNRCITSWNSGAERVFGYSASEMIGAPITTIIPLELRDEEAGILKRIREGHRVQQLDTIRVCKDGSELAISITVSPIRNAQGEVVGVSKIARDISERKRAEAELRLRSEELARSNSELQQFAYSASHDLQEPLRAVTGFVQLLRRRYGGQIDSRADEYITHAIDGAARMQQLIDALLSYSRVGARGVNKEVIDCNVVVRNAIANLHVAIEEAGAVVTIDPLPQLSADATRLMQIFQNLIANAIKFHGSSAPIVRVSHKIDGKLHVFSVSDNGIGIESRHFDRIFGVFQRLHTRDQYPGTGIGLALCAKIAILQGGTIWVESRIGAGSTFCFSIPVEAVIGGEPAAMH